MNAKQTKLLCNYNHAKISGLYEAYASPSRAKIEAYQLCLATQADYGGYGGRITGYNSHSFSYAFKYRDNLNNVRLYYITASNNYDFIIE